MSDVRLRLRPGATRAVLFDLDGTLVDTIGDIALALNRALMDHNLERVPLPIVRAWVGKGAPRLIARAFERADAPLDEKRKSDVFMQFIAHYEQLHEQYESTAALFPGVLTALTRLQSAGLALSVVTNKQKSLACATLRHVGVLQYFAHVVGGDTCAHRKPHPMPLVHACSLLGIAESAAVMVGDSMNDVGAARAAGIPVVCVPYGYNEGEAMDELSGDYLINHFSELPALLGL
jgi:phosphoglycolate phosphatase